MSERPELVLARADRKRAEPDPRRGGGFGSRGPGDEDDADRLLNALKDASGYVGLMAFGRTVDDPDVIGLAAEVVAHLLEAGAVKEPGDRDEANDAGVMVGVVVEHLPGGPAPEVDVEVAEVLGVCPDAPLARGLPGVERRRFGGVGAPGLDPPAAPHRLFFIRRVADDDGDRLSPLDRVRLLTGLGDRPEDGGEPFILDVGAAQGIGDVQTQGGRRSGPGEFRKLGEDSELCHRERAELEFEPDEPSHRRVDRLGDRPRPFVGLHPLGDEPEDAEQERPRADRRIGQGDRRRRQPGVEVEPAPKDVVHQPDHCADDFGRGVVRTGLLP